MTTTTGTSLRTAGPKAGTAPATTRVRAVIPCFNRPGDLRLLLQDLARLDTDLPGGARIELSVLVIDNASDPPLQKVVENVRAEVGTLDLRIERLASNVGGSGGFNAGLARWLSEPMAKDGGEEMLWLLDSDARVEPGCLIELVRTLHEDQGLAVVGSALVDPDSGRVFELGGRIDRRTGEYVQPLPEGGSIEGPIRVEYVAACSMLVRRSAAERAGLLRDLFLNGDDVEWCLRITRVTGLAIAAVPASRAVHPHPDRMRTGARYYAARNAPAAIDAALGDEPSWRRRWVRLARCVREVGRAVGQRLVGRNDLAELHIRGVRDASRGITGAAPEPLVFEPFVPVAGLAEAVQRELATQGPGARVVIRRGCGVDEAALGRELRARCIDPILLPEEPPAIVDGLARLLLGPRRGMAVVSARSRPSDWLLARRIASVTPEGFIMRRVGHLTSVAGVAGLVTRGGWWSLRVAARALPAVVPSARTTPNAPAASATAAFPSPAKALVEVKSLAPLPPVRLPSLSVLILSYNRWGKLEHTLRKVAQDPSLRGAQVIVADNGSTDGTPSKLAAGFPEVESIALGHNRGVGAFNRAAKRATGDVLFILDDDAWPEPGAVERALRVLADRAEIAAVPLHPRHPASRASEWPFAEGPHDPEGLRDRWPVMGCGNLVRRAAWDHVGGYDEGFFLYRNDTDLAMKLLECGYGVHFDPALVVWHDSPAAARKSRRWFELATRNWLWLCRRHGAGWSGLTMAAMGAAHAHRLAGWRIGDHLAAARGWWEGITRRVPPTSYMDVSGERRGRALRDLMTLRFSGRRRRPDQPA